MIPKRIHQIWLGDQSRQPVELMESIRLMNPDWEYWVWTDDNIPSDLKLLDRLHAVPEYEQPAKADLLRYEILYRYGGFYVDADSEALLPFTDDLLQNDSFACWENEYIIPGWIANGYLGATQGNYLMRKLVEMLYETPIEKFMRIEEGGAAMFTGPRALTDMVKQMQYTYLRIYPSHYFIPEHYTGVVQPRREPTYTKQYFGSTKYSSFNYGQ